MSKIKIAFIGAGKITEKYLQVISDTSLNRIFILDSITSRTRKKAISLSKKYYIKYVFENIEDLINKRNPEAFLIFVSADQIYKVLRKVIPLKIPFLVEKPISSSLEEINNLKKLYNKFKTPNIVSLNRRHYSIFKKVNKFINNKLVGFSIEGHENFDDLKKKVPSNYLKKWDFYNSIHTIDLLRYFGGEPIKILSLSKENKFKSIICILLFKKGVTGTYISHKKSFGNWSVKLFLENCYILFNPLEKCCIFYPDGKKIQIHPDKYDINFKPGFYNQMIFFKNFLKTKKLKWPSQDILEISKTINLINKIK